MNYETTKKVFEILALAASAAFSIFMMYSMHKTKKAAEKMVDTTKEMSETLTGAAINIQESMNNLFPKQNNFHLPTDDELYIPTHDINLSIQNVLLDKENKIIPSNCCNAIIKYHDLRDALICQECENQVNDRGIVL